MRITSTYQTFVARDFDQPAIVTKDETIFYNEWLELVQRTAASFSKQTSVNKRVALFLPNGRLFLQLFAGASMAGWANIVCDIRWTETEIHERLIESKPDLIIADSKMRESFAHIETAIIYTDIMNNWIEPYQDFHTQDTNAPFYIGFTSGSTGKPKAFVRSHHSWIESFRCNEVDLGMTEKDHVLIPGSFVNSTFLYGAISTLYMGGTVYLLSKFSPARLRKVLENEPISHIYVVPTMMQALIENHISSERPVTFISTGAKWLPNVKEQMKTHFPNSHFYEFYGSSETSYITFLTNDEQQKRPDSVGKAFHNVEIRIRDTDGNELPSGQEGILFVKSKMLFDGYLNHDGKTSEILQNNWATVYDIAKMDEAGFVYILGRKNDMIIYGGTNVYPQEIEQVIMKYDGVEEVVVLGIPDDYWGEKIAVCIKGNVSVSALKNYCRRHLSTYKIPRIWRKVNTFPYTTGGKISRQEVKKWFEKDAYL